MNHVPYHLTHSVTGNSRRMFKYTLIIPGSIFFAVYITVIAFKVGYNVEYMLMGLSFFYLCSGVVLLIAITINSLRTLYDNIHLRGEILYGCAILMNAIVWDFTVQIIDFAKYSVGNDRYQQVFNFIVVVMGSTTCFALMMVSTQYPRYWERNIDKTQQITPLAGPSGSDRSLIQRSPTTLDEMSSLMQDIDLQAFLCTESGLIAFLTHLGKEYEIATLVVK